ncbi:MAG: Veg family protein [Lactobacillus sp.]|nr:Veg family protein [Lactobacillus sp.]
MPSSIVSIKKKLEEHLGETLTVTSQTGRKKGKARSGILKQTFPAVFMVELDQEENNFERVSYSYTDLLTNSIKLEFEGAELSVEE